MIGLGNVLKTSLQDVLKMSVRCPEDVLKTFLQDVLKTYGQDEYIGLDQDVLKTSPGDEAKDVFIKTNVCWVKQLSV